MPLRFYRRVKLFPGLRINLSKGGASVSVGRKGMWLTTGPRGRRVTVGLPGTGLSWTERAPPLVALVPRSQSFLVVWGWPLVTAAIVAIAWWLG
jgi:Protein of unknown function (DUF4236)